MGPLSSGAASWGSLASASPSPPCQAHSHAPLPSGSALQGGSPEIDLLRIRATLISHSSLQGGKRRSWRLAKINLRMGAGVWRRREASFWEALSARHRLACTVTTGLSEETAVRESCRVSCGGRRIVFWRMEPDAKVARSDSFNLSGKTQWLCSAT